MYPEKRSRLARDEREGDLLVLAFLFLLAGMGLLVGYLLCTLFLR